MRAAIRHGLDVRSNSWCAWRNPGLLSQPAIYQIQQLILEFSGFSLTGKIHGLDWKAQLLEVGSKVCLCAHFVLEILRELQTTLPTPLIFLRGWQFQLAKCAKLQCIRWCILKAHSYQIQYPIRSQAWPVFPLHFQMDVTPSCPAASSQYEQFLQLFRSCPVAP